MSDSVQSHMKSLRTEIQSLEIARFDLKDIPEAVARLTAKLEKKQALLARFEAYEAERNMLAQLVREKVAEFSEETKELMRSYYIEDAIPFTHWAAIPRATQTDE